MPAINFDMSLVPPMKTFNKTSRKAVIPNIARVPDDVVIFTVIKMWARR